MRILVPTAHVLVKWTHTQQSKIVRPDRYRQSGTNNADANIDDRRWHSLTGFDRLALVELNMHYYRWTSVEMLAILLATDIDDQITQAYDEIRESIQRLHGTLGKLVRYGLATRRGREWRAVVTSDGFDVGLVIAIGCPDPGVRPGEYVLFDSGSAVSFGWPPTKAECEAGEDGMQAGWAGHKLACLLDDESDPPEDELPGSEACRNWYHFVPTERLAASLGFEKPRAGEIG